MSYRGLSAAGGGSGDVGSGLGCVARELGAVPTLEHRLDHATDIALDPMVAATGVVMTAIQRVTVIGSEEVAEESASYLAWSPARPEQLVVFQPHQLMYRQQLQIFECSRQA